MWPSATGWIEGSEEGVALSRTLLVPLGATEQHGPHLPFDTDTRVAVAWAEAVASASSDWLAAPALPYGSSGEHQSFPGTLSIGGEALHHLLIELARSARRSFARIVYLSGHAGNVEPVSSAVSQLRTEGHDANWFVPTWPDRADIDAHAGRTETSLMLHLHPAEVVFDRAVPGASAPVAELMPLMRSGGVAAVSANGILGDPTTASPTEGQVLFSDLVDRTIAALNPSLGGPDS